MKETNTFWVLERQQDPFSFPVSCPFSLLPLFCSLVPQTSPLQHQLTTPGPDPTPDVLFLHCCSQVLFAFSHPDPDPDPDSLLTLKSSHGSHRQEASGETIKHGGQELRPWAQTSRVSALVSPFTSSASVSPSMRRWEQLYLCYKVVVGVKKS